jgi:hypothetical protein
MDEEYQIEICQTCQYYRCGECLKLEKPTEPHQHCEDWQHYDEQDR